MHGRSALILLGGQHIGVQVAHEVHMHQQRAGSMYVSSSPNEWNFAYLEDNIYPIRN